MALWVSAVMMRGSAPIYCLADRFCRSSLPSAIGAISGDNVVEGRTNELNQGPTGSLQTSGEIATHGESRRFSKTNIWTDDIQAGTMENIILAMAD